MILISFVYLSKIHNFSKTHGCGTKNKAATPLRSSNLKQVWWAQFLSHTLKIFEELYFKIKMGMAGPIFEPHPCNFEK